MKRSDTLVIIPAYNEALSIPVLAKEFRAINEKFDIVVIDDGSTDETTFAAKNNSLNVITLANNLGIGGAVQTGFIYAKEKGYQYAVQVDGDGQHPPKEIKKLLQKMVTDDADVVIGSRFIEKKGFQSTIARRAGINLINAFVWFFSGLKIKDCTSGFRAYNQKAISFLSENYPEDYPEPEALVVLKRNGFKIIERSVIMEERISGKSSITALKSVNYVIKVLFALLINFLRRRNDL